MPGERQGGLSWLISRTSWSPHHAQLGFDADAADPPFLKAAMAELAKADG